MFGIKIISRFWRFKYKKIRESRICFDCSRNKTSVQENVKSYSHTILVPKTSFPARCTNSSREEIQKNAQFSSLYNWQRENTSGSEYVLHDGPPYANGDLHMGHAVNKIIKDICNRSQVLQNRKVHYIPGWDCHGLPIELKALQKTKNPNKSDQESVETRTIARNFALKTVQKQKDDFQSWGIMGDWDKQFYLTMDKDYVRNQLRQFYIMYQRGLVYRTMKPVYWSPSSKTALAEAELEYDPVYRSKEVYVSFPLDSIPDCMKDFSKGKKICALIWTTTPWTLVSNRAICFNSQLMYNLVSISGRQGVYLIGKNLSEAIEKSLNVKIGKIAEFNGNQLQGITYYNKLTDKTSPFLESDHVTDSKGTGLVHTAPAHGPEDFLVALKNNIPVECNVDESGRYTGLGDLDNLHVLNEGQDAVISKLGDCLIHQGVYVHSYPLDWRTKQPVILRASHQWFIDTTALKKRALESLEKIKILPPMNAEQYRQGFKVQLEKRPYWCISRQRAWGTPIPVIYADEKPIVDERIIDNLCNIMDEKGSDVWWTCDVQDLLNEDIIKEYGLDGKTVTKGKDILDIWLDSGLTWSHVLQGRTADLYVEGVDQFTGWFQSSLLTCIALENRAPYKSILVHGFVVDEKRRKMSKSLGNVIDPVTVIHGGKNRQTQPAYGIDTLRWWVASHATQHSQIVVSNKLLDDCTNEILRLRNIFKFLLGVIGDLEKAAFYKQPAMNYFDTYIITDTKIFQNNITESYNSYRYNSIVQAVLNFISNKVSALYGNCLKDRLYCSQKDSPERLCAQLVLNTVLITLCKCLAPILPHLVEEVWSNHPLYDKPFYFTENIPIITANTDTELMELLLEIKKELFSYSDLKKLKVTLELNSELLENFKVLSENDVCEVLDVSSVSLVRTDCRKYSVKVTQTDRNRCVRCRKYNVCNGNDVCDRCEEVLLSYK